MQNGSLLEKNLLELIRRTSTDLPGDVEAALQKACSREKRHSAARDALEQILANVKLARRNDTPICQDTGTLNFFCRAPASFDENAFKAAARNAVSRATILGYLRQNTIDSVTGTTYPTNVAHGSPAIHFERGAINSIEVRLLMKGGGCENMGRQYSLPDERLNAARDLEGVRLCVLDAVNKAQGAGCAPGIIGVCIGGDREMGQRVAKEELLRKVGEFSRFSTLAKLERRLLKDIRELGVGPMGFGGNTTALAVKIGAASRLPASFFVTVSYMCWACRRRGARLSLSGGVKRWLA